MKNVKVPQSLGAVAVFASKSAFLSSVIAAVFSGAAPANAQSTSLALGSPLAESHVHDAASSTENLRNYAFDFITPTGQRIFSSALNWMTNQAYETDVYAQPGKCATNVSRVFEDAGIYHYSATGLIYMVEKARARGARVVRIPRDKAGMIAAFNSINGGKLPVGTLISGCKNFDCSGNTGDGHVSFVGDIDANGNTRLYHNNWFRPDSLGPDGDWQPNMVSRHFYYDLGLLRQWMPTPWMKFYRNASGQIVDVKSLMPEIDDLDPFNYHITATVVSEILRELP